MWDLQGQDRVVGGLNKIFCKGAAGALVVADITEIESLESTVHWKKKVNEMMNQTLMAQSDQIDLPDYDESENIIPIFLVVNKVDLVEELRLEGH